MRVLLFETTVAERHRLDADLSSCGHSVSIPLTAERFLAEAREDPPDVALVDLTASLSAPTGVVTALRGMSSTKRPYIIGIVGTAVPKLIASAWSAGVDDIMRKGAPREEVRGRVDAPTRIARWSTPAPPAAPNHWSPVAIENLKVWRSLDSLLASELAEMLGVGDLTVASGTEPPTQAAEVPMTLPEHGLYLRLAVGVDNTSAERIAGLLYGERVPQDVFADTLREVSNTAAGVMKRSAIGEGLVFTIGLPISCSAPARRPEDRCCVLAGDGFTLSVLIRRCALEARHVIAHSLRPRMVLAEDIRNAAGVLLLAAGTALTDRTVERVVTVLGGGAPILVFDPDSTGAPTSVAA